jgi:predicted Zn-dependent protease
MSSRISFVADHERLVRRGVRQAEIELAADYLGLYIMARAGYDVGAAPPFFRRLAANFPRLVNAGPTHPSSSYRYVAMTKAVTEIRGRIAKGTALMPPTGPSVAQSTTATADR